jgi:hypothetical protein
MAMAQFRPCMSPSEVFLLLMVTILELLILDVLWSSRIFRERSAIVEAAREWMEANRIHIVDIDVDIDNELQTFSSSQVRAKVRARVSSWRWMVPNDIAEYIEEHSLYQDMTRYPCRYFQNLQQIPKTLSCANLKKKRGWPDRSSRGLSPVGSATEMRVDNGHAHLCMLQYSVDMAALGYFMNV